MSKSEEILAAAKRSAQAHGYGGLNFRDLADDVGIKAASIYHHFPSKVDLGAAVAKRYWEDAAVSLDAISNEEADPHAALRRYPEVFRKSLESDNRLCLGSFLAAENDDLPDAVTTEIQRFTDVNVDWLARMLHSAGVATSDDEGASRARAIFASVAGAQLMARGRSDIALFDALIDAYRISGPLLP